MEPSHPFRLGFLGLAGLGLLLMLDVSASAQAPPKAPTTSGVEIDHLILAIDDLQKGIEQFARLTGVRPEFGGEHPGRGTANALVSLGKGRYLEIIAPASAEARVDPSWGSIAKHKALTPVGWALHARDLVKTIETLRAAGFTVSDPEPGSRKRADGSTLHWQTASLGQQQFDLEPFFIQWGEETPHPSTTSPKGCELVSVAIASPKPESLRKLVQTVGIEVQISEVTPAGIVFTLDCARGEVTFPEAEPVAPKE